VTTPNELMRYALGVQEDYKKRWSKPYRNYFVAGGSDADTWYSLATQGLAKLLRNGSEISGGDPIFAVTDEGKKYALAGITYKCHYGYGSPENP